MSIPLCNSKPHRSSTTYVKRSAVNVERAESLADYVRRVRSEKKLSLNDVVRQSGNQIANSHVSRIENAFSTNVTPEKLKALAKGLGVSEDEIFAVARGKSRSDDPSLTELRLLDGFRSLPADKQSDVIAYVEMMRDRYGPAHVVSDEAPDLTDIRPKTKRVPVVMDGTGIERPSEKKRA